MAAEATTLTLANLDVDQVAAGAFATGEDLERQTYRPHAHRRHQLLYAVSGALHLEVEGRQWLLPPLRAAWIRAGVVHSVRADAPVRLRLVYFDRRWARTRPELTEDACRVFLVSPLLRELLAYIMRWGPDRSPHDARANRAFAACADVCAELVHDVLPVWLPSARTPELAVAMSHLMDNLGSRASMSATARAAGLSERSLARRFRDETNLTFRSFLRAARLLRATELLAAPGARVTDAALAVGFDSLAAFTRAFQGLLGESPSSFRRRSQEVSPSPPLARRR